MSFDTSRKNRIIEKVYISDTNQSILTKFSGLKDKSIKNMSCIFQIYFASGRTVINPRKHPLFFIFSDIKDLLGQEYINNRILVEMGVTKNA